MTIKELKTMLNNLDDNTIDDKEVCVLIKDYTFPIEAVYINNLYETCIFKVEEESLKYFTVKWSYYNN